jgi:hypothetical protein
VYMGRVMTGDWDNNVYIHQGRSVDWMLWQYSPHWFVVIPARMYVSVFERLYRQLCVLVQQDIDLRHLSQTSL